MRISDPEKIRDIVEHLKREDAKGRAANRAALNDLYNGAPPWTEKEAEENHIFTNVQPLIAPRVAHEARRQLAQATMRNGRFFKVSVDLKDKSKAEIVSYEVTNRLNRILRGSMRFYEILRGADANVVIHGRGPSMWDDRHAWCPVLLSIEDLKVPTNAYVDFSNVSFFAVYQEASAAELLRKISGKNVDPGWNVPAVKRLIASLADDQFQDHGRTDYDFPEKLAEQFKQNGLYYASDLIPTAKLWWFYQLTDDEDEPRWELSIIQDVRDSGKAGKAEFLYQQRSGFATSIDQILHVQYADGGNVAPFRYHSVRGMGYLLYPVLNMTNRLFCRWMDSLFEACNQLFRNIGEEDRDKLAMVMLANMSILPRGIEYVPAQERYAVDHNLINAGYAMLRQLINENSASFIADPDAGTRKEMTATQVLAQVQQAGVLLTSLVQMQSIYRQKQYREICRRFTLSGSTDKDVKAFQEGLRKDGISEDALEFERWEVTPERAIGGGNKVLEISQVNELMAALQLYPPQSQRIILRDFTLAHTDDPDKAMELVPETEPPPSNTARFATLAFGTLAQGGPVIVPDDVDPIEYATVLLSILGNRVSQLMSNQIVPSQETAIGLVNVAQHIGGVLERSSIAGARPEARQLMAQLQSVMAAIQQLASQVPQGQLPPDVAAKVRAIDEMTAAKVRAQEAAAEQRMRQREMASQQRLAAEKLKLQAEIEAKDYKTAADLAAKRLQSKMQATQNAPQESAPQQQTEQ